MPKLNRGRTRNTRSHIEYTQFLLRVKLDEPGVFRSGTYQTHFSADDVDQLGQFVNLTCPQNSAEWSHPCISRGCNGRSRPFTSLDHRPKLHQAERSSEPPDPNWPKKDWAWRSTLHGKRHHCKER